MKLDARRSQFRIVAGVLAAAGLASVAGVHLSGEGQQAPSAIARPARTADGKPDLTGTWSNATITPLERPQGVSNLVLSAEEAARMEKTTADRVERLNQDSDPNRTAPPQGGDGSTGAAGNVGGYNNFWLDPGERVAVVDGQFRSSLIIDPPDGRAPAPTPEARARNQARMKMMEGRGQYDHPEFRPLAERCLLSFGPTTPLIPNYFYNNNIQIVQTPDHVMILMEMVHDARMVRIGGTHVPTHIRPWMGDSIGHWEGDTLVVDTTNFPLQQPFRGSAENLHVIERFRRVDATTINYRFTVDDPTTFARPFTGEIPFRATDELIYEYACHEGNYALANVLSGARNEEKRQGTKK
ncbi:MAG: hypothetical protein WC815_12235 [Vicinamibacterales bacterium]|jgi:hypothetical protein